MSLITMGYCHRTVITMGLGNGILITRHKYYTEPPRIHIIESGDVDIVEKPPEVNIEELEPPKISIDESTPELKIEEE